MCATIRLHATTVLLEMDGECPACKLRQRGLHQYLEQKEMRHYDTTSLSYSESPLYI